MITVFIQTGLCLLAGLALWKMWRAVDTGDRLVRFIVLAGFVARAVLGTLLFWISWLRLPLFTRVQMGNGLWFYATDGKLYLAEAASLAEGGLRTIVTHHRTGASVSYVQTLATFTMLLGDVASVAVLLNLFSYLGMCLIILTWLKAVPSARTPALIALTAISFSPSAMLWSTQPLKDTLFQFLIVCLIAAGAAWQRTWLREPEPRVIVTSALVMILALFMTAGIRWYFGLVVLAASALFFLAAAVASPRRWKAFTAGAVTFFLMSQSLVVSASGYLPPYLQKALSPWKPSSAANTVLTTERVVTDLNRVRSGFENSGGATSIGVGGALARIDPGREVVPLVLPTTAEEVAELARQKAAAQETGRVAAPSGSGEGKTEEPSPGALAVATRNGERRETLVVPAQRTTELDDEPLTREPSPEASQGTRTSVVSQAATEDGAKKTSSAATGRGPSVTPRVEQPAGPVAPRPVVAGEAARQESDHARRPNSSSDLKTATDSLPSGPLSEPREPTRPMRGKEGRSEPTTVETENARRSVPAAGPIGGGSPAREERGDRAPLAAGGVRSASDQKISPASPGATSPETASAPEPSAAAARASSPAPATTTSLDGAAEGAGLGGGVIQMPTSTAGRLLAGGVAILLPSGIAKEMGLLEMGGGRGFWWFTDLDSIVFDLMLIVAIAYIVRRGQWGTLRNPIFWFVLLVAGVVVPIAYIITNYGTLFRLRAMLFVTIALIPLAIANRVAGETIPETETSDPAGTLV